MYDIKIDQAKCTGCGECVDICPMEVLEIQNEKSVAVKMDECEGCESCVATCPEEAITVTEG